MPAKIANLDTEATDLHIVEQALRRATELRDEFAAIAELKHLDSYARNALEDARDRMVDVVEDLDFDVQQLRGPAQTAEWRSEQDSLRRDLATAVEG